MLKGFFNGFQRRRYNFRKIQFRVRFTRYAHSSMPLMSLMLLMLLMPLMPLACCLSAASDAVPPREHFQHPVSDRTQMHLIPTRPEQEQSLIYGRSVQDRPLQAFVLGSGTNVTLVFGGFHGNERSGPGVVRKLHLYLQQHPEKWRDCQIILVPDALVPDANPDGWRTGMRDNAHHVDINRNFPGTWKPATRAARYNPGPAAASEPETQAIIRLVTLYSPTKVISIHQPLHLLNWTGLQSRTLAAVMAQRDHYPVSSDVGYPTPVSFGNYCGRRGIAIVTLEMTRGSISKGGGRTARRYWQQLLLEQQP